MNKINLNRQDWIEIFYALESKISSGIGDGPWRAHLEAIKKKIGPDGYRAFKLGVASKPDDWWTVALAWSEDLSGKQLHRYVESAGGGMSRAIDFAKSGFIRALEDASIRHDDIVVVGVFKGKPDNKLGEFIKRTSGE